MRVCLFEDRSVRDLEPLTLTRPAFDLLCGCTPLADKQLRAFAPADIGAIVRPYLAGLTQQVHDSWRVNDLAWLRAGPVVLVNARWLPAGGVELSPSPHVGLVGDEVAYVSLTPAELLECSPFTIDHYLARWRNTLPARQVGGLVARYLWELIDHNGDAVRDDVWWQSPTRPRRTNALPAVVGSSDDLHVHPSARIDPMVVLDTTLGPVVIDRDAVVGAFSHLEGPCFIGAGTRVQGAKVRAGTSIGPRCRIGGEVEASIVQGHSNKAHDGFLGHAFVGEWVNLGAGTCNSDLRNDYGTVRVMVNDDLVDTARNKVGCFLGDHTKSGLGTLLNTGTRAGVFCNLLPSGGLLPRDIPSFGTAQHSRVTESADIAACLTTADRVMRRRNRTLDEQHERLYRWLWTQAEQGAPREVVGYRLPLSA